MLTSTLSLTIFIGFLILYLICSYVYRSVVIGHINRIQLYKRIKNNKKHQTTKIPKIIHQTLRSKKNIPQKFQKNIDYIKKMNPTWEYRLYDDEDIDKYILTHYSKKMHKAYLLINPKYGPAKSDLFRYLVMYREGGVYLDIKSAMKFPLDHIISDTDEYILSYWPMRTLMGHNIAPQSEILGQKEGEFQQWHIMCVPKHPALKKVIDNVLINIEHARTSRLAGKQGVLMITGPIVYTYSIIPLLNMYNFTIYSSHINLGLIYNNTNTNHKKVFVNSHYSTLTEPVILT